MLVLTRRIGERIMIGDDIVVTIVDIAVGKCKVGIDAPTTVVIAREELLQKKPKCDHCQCWINEKNHGQTTASTTLCIDCIKKSR